VVYADRITKTETNDNGDASEREIPFMKGYTVFNVEQVDNLPAHFTAKVEASNRPKLSLPQPASPFSTAVTELFTPLPAIWYRCRPERVFAMLRAIFQR
jgi:hypothetical protein